MPPRSTATKHYKNGPGVAMCGARDGAGNILVFVWPRAAITCDVCRDRLEASIAKKRARGAA